MAERTRAPTFHSPLGPLIEAFLREKRACGYRYARGSLFLQSLDRFLVREQLNATELARDAVERFTRKQPHEKHTNQAARRSYVRQFAQFLLRQGHKAFIPTTPRAAGFRYDFVPHVFSVDELRKLFTVADRLQPDRNARLRHLVFPELLRVLYGCGLRAGEALKLTVGDVDLLQGIITVREGKFRKDRLVPMAPALLERLRAYSSRLGERSARAPFFPNAGQERYSNAAVYSAFRNLLWRARIPHGGRGRGPRVHDLRHTFAVHRLTAWYREGADLGAKLPVLATYMGHVGLEGTQRYLRLSADLYLDVTARQEAHFAAVIPRGDA